MKKRLLALLLALAMLFSMTVFLAGCGDDDYVYYDDDDDDDDDNDDNDDDDGGKKPLKPGRPVVDDVVIDGSDLKYDSTYTIEMWMPDNTDVEMEGCYVDTLLEKTLNMNLNITEYESRDQYETLIAQQKIPTLTFANAQIFGPAYGPLGAYIDWNDYIDQMPNVKRWLKDDPRFQADLENYTEEDGSIYQLPVPQTGYADVYGFLYRKDIFDKHNLTFPTTQEGLMEVLRELKRIYGRNCYPFVQRGLNGANLSGLTSLADLFDADYTGVGVYNTLYRLDMDTNTYYLSQTSDNMRECLQWLHDLYQEGLLHPACLTMDTAQWAEALANTSFVTYDKMDRIQMLTMCAIDANPYYVLTGAPGFKMGTNGDGTHAIPSAKYSFLVSGALDADSLLKVLQYIDFLYSDRGIELTNWGEKGISFEGDGYARDFKDSFTYEGSGLGVPGLCGFIDFDIYCKSQEQNVIDAIWEVSRNHTETEKGYRLTYTDTEQRYFDTYFQKTYDLCQARFQEFIQGHRIDPAYDWDDYVQEIEDSLPAEMMKIHNDALARYKARHPEKFQ